MSMPTGLADRARYEAFARQWRDTVLKEAAKWCDDDESQQLLTDAVLAEFRKKYAYSDPPRNLDYYFRAQVCLVYSMTGQNTRKLQQYLDSFAMPEEVPQEAVILEEAPQEAARIEAPAPVTAQVPAPAPVSAPPVQAQVPAQAPKNESAPAPAAAAPVVTADTFYDPVRTTFWTPDSEKCEHVVREIELPDEEEEERSTIISFINTILFLFTAGSFVFCVYETGFFQYLLQ